MTRELRLRLVLGLNLALAAALVVAGVIAHSLGLFAAAGDTVTDVAAVLLSLLAVRMAKRSPTAQRSFGYHRSTILAAQANAAAILVVSGVIAIEAIRRLQDPPTVHGGLVLVVVGVVAAVNGVAALVLAGDHHDLNMRAVMLDTVGDAAANTGVALAGAVILATGAYEWLDPAVSLAIAVVIAIRAVRLLLQAADVLLESTPSGLDLGELASTITATNGVDAVHDIHVWSLSSEVTAMSAHLVLTGHPTLEEAQVVGDRVRATIGPRFGIAHATLELECEACVQSDGEPCAELLDGPMATSGTSGLLRRHRESARSERGFSYTSAVDKMHQRDEMLLALDEPTTAIVAHGLLNSMAAVSGTAHTLLNHWELFTEDPEQARALLDRIVRQATMASGVLEDLVRGLPPDVASALASIER